jgi:hypothetical protein
MLISKTKLLTTSIVSIFFSFSVLQDFSLATQVIIPSDSKFKKENITCENGEKYTIRTYSKIADNRRIEITKYPLKAILGCYGQYNLNDYNEASAVVYTLESARKLMACARKKQAGILIANFPDYRAKARELSARCVK